MGERSPRAFGTVGFCIVVAAANLAFAPIAAAQLAPRPATPPGAIFPGVAPVAPRASSPAPRATLPDQLLDRVVAVVNDEAVTQYELDEQRRTVLGQMQAAKVTAPPADVLDRQLLERLVNERALLQFAKDTGIRVDDTQVERTIIRVAQDNKLSPDEFRRMLEKEKIPYAKYREEIRREIVIQRLREREVDNRLFVSDAEVDNYLQTIAAQSGGDNEYLLSHILVLVPEQATPDVLEKRRLKAEDALRQAKSGTDFGQVAAAMSDAPDALQGGSLGWRSTARLPSVFAENVRTMSKGDISPLLRSSSGFHIVMVADLRSRNQPTVVEQTRARHILIKVNEITSEAEAKARIERIKDRLDTGAKFEEMARVNSEDASSAKGGDLGWINPGDTVPDFEQAMNALKIGDVSGPVRTPFGYHLIQVQERRTQDITKDRQRDQARLAIRQRKSDEAFAEFVRQTRDRTYVEFKTDER